MLQKGKWIYPGILTLLFVLNSCSKALEWPESPLYNFEEGESYTTQPTDQESAQKAIVGHYAHFDVVAYEDKPPEPPCAPLLFLMGILIFTLRMGY